jgi:hypothetical protein
MTMKKYLKPIFIFAITSGMVLGAMSSIATAACLPGYSGGTGICSSSTAGDYLQVVTSTPTSIVWTVAPAASAFTTSSINGVTSTAWTLASSTYLGITSSGTTFTFTNLGVTTNTGNWAGTWQSKNATDFAPSTTVSSQWTLTGSNLYPTSASDDVSIGTSTCTYPFCVHIGTNNNASIQPPLSFTNGFRLRS